MSDFDEVRAALHDGARSAQFQFSQASNLRTRDDADENRKSIARALKALDRIVAVYKPCTLPHIEREYQPETSCQCATVRIPPCSWCENGGSEVEHAMERSVALGDTGWAIDCTCDWHCLSPSGGQESANRMFQEHLDEAAAVSV